jgi:hypothetical protein
MAMVMMGMCLDTHVDEKPESKRTRSRSMQQRDDKAAHNDQGAAKHIIERFRRLKENDVLETQW